MSKCIIFSDVHVGEYTYGKIDAKTGLNQRLLDIQVALDHIYQHSIKNGVEHILIGGDCYDRKVPKNHVRQIFTHAIKKFLKKGLQVHILTGNHDQALSSHTNHSLIELQGLNDLVSNIHVYDTPEIIKIDDVDFALLPFVNKNEYSIDNFREWNKEKMLEFSNKVNSKSVMIGHFGTDLSMFVSEGVSVPEDMIEIDFLKSLNFKYIVLGHIHKKQDLHLALDKGIFHVGSVIKTSFNEEGDTKYFMELDTDTMNYEFIEIPDRPFYTFELDLVANSIDKFEEKFIEAQSINLEDAITRIKLKINESDLTQIDVNKFTDYLGKNSYKFMSLIKNIIPSTKTTSEICENNSPEEALTLYINENKDFFGDELDLCLKYGREILSNVGG